MLVEATKATFDDGFRSPAFRNVWVSMEYPDTESSYPGIWVDFTPTADLQVAGINHVEWTPGDAAPHKITRWRFAGLATFTLVAMTSLERDRLTDALVSVMAFGMEDPSASKFRTSIEQNDLIGLQMQWDKFAMSGKAETPGTPWGTDDVVYEITVSIDCQGEFLSDGTEATYARLSQIAVSERIEGEALYEPPLTEPVNADWH